MENFCDARAINGKLEQMKQIKIVEYNEERG